MKRYSEDLIEKARKLRTEEKLSYREIGRRINVSSNTIGNWLQGPVGNKWDTLVINNERKRDKFRKSELSVVPDFNLIDKKQAKFLAALLYGCEGSKYPSHKGVAFANSDPNLVVAFLKLLRKSFLLKENRLSVHLQIHSHHDFKTLKRYWSELLEIPEINFIKPTITTPKGGKHRKKYQGTCTLKYGDYRIQLKLLGIFEAFIKKVAKSSFC